LRISCVALYLHIFDKNNSIILIYKQICGGDTNLKADESTGEENEYEELFCLKAYWRGQ
jgi:hypothetical protein